MMNDEIVLPTLLRQVRTAVIKQQYKEAEALYAKIMSYPEMQDNLDLKMRHAICAEKIGKIDVALKCYQDVVVSYHEQGEVEAAERLEKSIVALYAEAEKKISDSIGGIEDLEEKCNITPLSDADLIKQLVKMGEKETLYPTEVLCEDGDIADKIWLIEEGVVDVFMSERAEKFSLEPKEGSFILLGELGLFTRQRRNARLVAYTTVKCIVVDIKEIDERQQRDIPFNTAMQRLLRDRWIDPVLKQHSVFDSISDMERGYLIRSFESVSLKAGETLASVGQEQDGAYLLQSGCMFLIHDDEESVSAKAESVDHATEAEEPVDIAEYADYVEYADYLEYAEYVEYTHTEHSGDVNMMTGIHPGDFVQLSGLLEGYKSKYRIEAVTNVQLLYLSRKKFEIFSKPRPWVAEAIERYSLRPAHLQVMRPLDDYFWLTNRDISFKKES